MNSVRDGKLGTNIETGLQIGTARVGRRYYRLKKNDRFEVQVIQKYSWICWVMYDFSRMEYIFGEESWVGKVWRNALKSQ